MKILNGMLLTDDEKLLIARNFIGALKITTGMACAPYYILMLPGHYPDLILDEQVAIVFEVMEGKILSMATYLSDVAGINAFFIEGI